MGDTHCLPFEANRLLLYFFPVYLGGGNAQTHTTEHTDTSPKNVPGRRSFLTLQVRSSAQTRGLWLNDRQAEKRCGLLIEWRSRSVNGVLLASGHHTTRIPWRGGGHPGRRSPVTPVAFLCTSLDGTSVAARRAAFSPRVGRYFRFTFVETMRGSRFGCRLPHPRR